MTTLARPAGRASLLQRHPLAAYFVLAYAFSWLIALPLAASAQGVIPVRLPFALHYLTAYGPMLAALLVTAATEGEAGVREIGRRLLRWRIGPLWALAMLMPALLFLVAVGALALMEGHIPNFVGLGDVNYLGNLGMVALLLWVFNSGIGEEIGWRGFALPHLQRHFNALTSSLLLSVLWIGWHIPFFFYVNTYRQMNAGMLLGLAFGIAAGAIVLTWLYNGTRGSLLAVVIWHGLLNFFTSSPTLNSMFAAVVSTGVMIAAVVIVLVCKPQNNAGNFSGGNE